VTDPSSAPPVPRSEWAALVLLLIVAAALRFTALDRDFQFGGPSFDERHNFIQPVHWMWERGTADPHVYSGYPGLFNHLIFVPVTLARELVGLEAAYVAARAVVAGFGLANVLLVWVLGRRLFGSLPALVGAGLLALSRTGIREAHQISPDVLVATALLGLLLVLWHPGAGPRHDLAAGALLGLATAVKYTGLMLAPALLASLAARGRLRRLLPSLGAAALAFAIGAPYAVFQRDAERGAGLLASLQHYFGPETFRDAASQDPERLGLQALLPLLHHDMGRIALLLALLSFALWRRPAIIGPPACVVAASAVAMAFATMSFPRHALVALAATAVLVMAGMAGALAKLPRRLAPALGGGIALAVLLVPASNAATFFARLLQPSGARLAQGWLADRLSGPARIATSLYGLPLPRERFEVRAGLVLADYPLALLDHFDAIVARERELDVPASWTEAARFETPETPAALLVLRPAPRRRGGLAPAPSSVAASEHGPVAELAFDGEASTAWSAGPGRGWIEARWDTPLLVERVDVDVGDPAHWPQRLLLLGGEGGRSERLEAPRLRPRFDQLRGLPHGQVFILTPPRRLDALRLLRQEGGAWSVAEIRVQLMAASGREREGS